MRCHTIVRGRVQGVFFRDSVRRMATDLGVTGWVRNCPDGSVEAVFEGEPDAVQRLVDFCRTGPPGAHVDEVQATAEEPRGEQGFAVE